MCAEQERSTRTCNTVAAGQGSVSGAPLESGAMPSLLQHPAIVLVILLAFNIWSYFSRCEASPDIDWSMLGFSWSISAIACVLLHFRDDWLELDLASKQPIVAMGVAGALLAGIVLSREAIQYADAIGQSKGYRSVGLACAAQPKEPNPDKPL